MRSHRVLLVAQSPVLRYGIRGILDAHGIAGEVREEAAILDGVAASIERQPTLVIVQDALTGVNGTVGGRALREAAPRTGVIVLADVVDDDRLVLALRHGVDALLPSASDVPTLVATIARIDAGDVPIAADMLKRPALTSRMTSAIRHDAHAAATDGAESFSGVEIAVMDGIVRGASNRDIAAALRIGEQAVRTHAAAVLRKLGATDRLSALVAAARSGYVDLGAQMPFSSQSPRRAQLWSAA